MNRRDLLVTAAACVVAGSAGTPSVASTGDLFDQLPTYKLHHPD
jgi:hypothetical protein